MMFLEESQPEIDPADVLDALSNEHDRSILALAQAKAIEAQEILARTSIPKSTLYRRLRQLEADGLIAVERGVVRDGHLVDRFRSRLSRVELVVSEGSIETRWTPAEHETSADREVWRTDPAEGTIEAVCSPPRSA